MRTLVRVTTLVIAVAVLAYAALPWWLPAISIAWLERDGAENVVIVISYPDLHGFQVDRFELEIDGFHIGIVEAQVEYRPGGLLDGRLALIRAARVFVRQLPSEEPSTTDAGFFIPPPALLWQYAPIDRIELDSIELQLEAPKLHVVGRFSLNATEVSYRFVNIAGGDLEGLTLAGHIERVGVVTATASLIDRSPAGSPTNSHAEGATRGDVLVSVEGRIDASGAADLTGSVSLADAEFELLDPLLDLATDTARLDAEFAIHYSPPEHPGKAPDDSPMRITVDGSFTLSWRGRLPLRADLSTAGSFSYQAGQWSVALSEATALTIATLADPALAVQLSNPADLVLTYEDDRLSIRGGLQLDVPETTVAGTTVGFEGGWLDIDRGVIESGGVRFEGQLSGITRVDARRIPALYAFTGGFAGEQVNGTLTLKAPGTTVHLPIQLSHNLASGTGEAQTVGEVAIDAPLMATILPGWGEAPGEVFDLVSGRLNLEGAATWHAGEDFELDATLRVELLDLGVVVAEMPFRRTTGILALVYRNGIWQARSDDLKIGELDVGFPVTDIGVSFSASAELLDISALNGNTLGAAFHTPPFRYAIATGNTSFDLAISNLSLAEVLSLQGEEITGSGRLSGMVPVTLTNNTLSVNHGRLESAPPGGVIRYAGAAAAVAAAGQPGLDFALRALGDFNYQRLTATVDYTEDGTLSAAVELVGNNPAVEQGRTIHYNLNITQNLPDLLLSLRLSDQLSQGIQNKLNR